MKVTSVWGISPGNEGIGALEKLQTDLTRNTRIEGDYQGDPIELFLLLRGINNYLNRL